MKTLFAGPFVGEFGWELFCWQGILRQYVEISNFDNVIILLSNNDEAINFKEELSLFVRDENEILLYLDNECFPYENLIKRNVSDYREMQHAAAINDGQIYCLGNNQAIAANYLIKKGFFRKILIVDLDVHQGNGTASIFQNINDVFTLSFHGKNNYPFKKEKSDIDIEFENGTDDKFYLKKLKNILPKTIDEFKPEFIFYLSGVDVMENDKLGKLSLSLEGCKERDRYVLELCKKNNIPLQISMGGGYSFELKNIIEAHSNTFRLAQEIFF